MSSVRCGSHGGKDGPIAFVYCAEEREQQEAKNNCAIRAGKTRQESYEEYHYKVAHCMKTAEDNI